MEINFPSFFWVALSLSLALTELVSSVGSQCWTTLTLATSEEFSADLFHQAGLEKVVGGEREQQRP
jgi:hypothetical protein